MIKHTQQKGDTHKKDQTQHIPYPTQHLKHVCVFINKKKTKTKKYKTDHPRDCCN